MLSVYRQLNFYNEETAKRNQQIQNEICKQHDQLNNKEIKSFLIISNQLERVRTIIRSNIEIQIKAIKEIRVDQSHQNFFEKNQNSSKDIQAAERFERIGIQIWIIIKRQLIKFLQKYYHQLQKNEQQIIYLLLPFPLY
ncbi:hypothetical protein ABPG74_018185 [Tetrahymena malaccensis]